MGLHPGEVLALPWSAVNLEKGVLTVSQALVRLPRGAVGIGTPKANSYRALRMPSSLVSLMGRHRREQKRLRMKAPAWEDNDLVFPTTIGTLMDHTALRNATRSIGELIGVPDLSPNELRHTAASLLIDGGAHPQMVSDLLGHRNGRMVAEVYRHKVQPVVDLSAEQERVVRG
jgi:integrase